MYTRKPISTISYNSIPFLLSVLTELLSEQKIDFYSFVRHLGEDDEAGKKDHIHLLLYPSLKLNTSDLLERFTETSDTLPLKCMPFRNSVPTEWLMYSLHNTDYLLKKGLKKRFSYTLPEFYSSDPDFLDCIYHEYAQEASIYSLMFEAIGKGMSWYEFVYFYQPDPHYIKQYSALWSDLTYVKDNEIKEIYCYDHFRV